MSEDKDSDFHVTYWNSHYEQSKPGWDMGSVSPPIRDYIDQLQNKELRILVPGAGRGWEVKYLFEQGFENTYLLDFSEKAIGLFRLLCPDFPESNIIYEDFFSHTGHYDLILEQTFFSSLIPEKRVLYVQKMHELLKPDGKLCGLLFNHKFENTAPPFGDTVDVYEQLFSKYFQFTHFKTAYNSIKPRAGRELFLLLKKNHL